MYDIYIYICVCGMTLSLNVERGRGGEENPGYDNTPKMKFEYWLNLKANKILGQIKLYWYKRVLRSTLPLEKEIEILLFIFPRCTANMDSIVWFWHRSKMDGFCSEYPIYSSFVVQYQNRLQKLSFITSRLKSTHLQHADIIPHKISGMKKKQTQCI